MRKVSIYSGGDVVGKYGNLCVGDAFGLWTVIGECHKDRFGHDSY